MRGSGKRAPRRPSGTGEMPGRSVRVADEPWEKARRRAAHEGITMSRMVALLVEGYGQGLIDLPKVQIVFTPTRPAADEPSKGDVA